ncbi:hypothetical protein EX30DRAFT_79903 [Ascodesmis nigricans]|uniref:VHS domain-containing protein n=1 Tax=Ascodesmis nigricans TaxID=341454 RepID=A0A4V3SIC5_9PEZI|nr:hypothetical protein EX30DRAFT_79903 [Ascodesmis nigricans]
MKKPNTAVTVYIERYTGEDYEEHELGGIPELIDAIKLQDTGPREASRAIRKKLKYGTVHRQLRALTILDALIANGGRTFQRTFADEPLLERLRIAATSPTTDPDVKARLRELFAQWAREYKDTHGLQSIAVLYKQFPQRKKPTPRPVSTSGPSQSSSTPRSPTSPPSTSHAGSSSSTTRPASKSVSEGSGWRSHKKSKSKTPAPFNLEKEKPQLNQTLANASVSTTNLTNALKRINREKERPSQKPEIVQQYQTCKQLKKSVQRYIQHIESEQWLGSLIHAHEELTMALEMYEIYDKPIEEDSDSENEWDTPALQSEQLADRTARMSLKENSPPPPPPPPRPVEKAEDDNPFGDEYEIDDENVKWKEV